MEKIKKRSMLWLWLPQVIAAGCIAVGGLFALIPVLGILIFAPIFSALATISFMIGVIYQVYFYYQLSLDINAICEGDGLETKSYLYVLVFNTFTFGIYGKYWLFKAAQRLQANAPRYGFKMIIGGMEMVVLDLVSAGWISAWEFVRNMNRFAAGFNSNNGPIELGGAK